MGDVNVSSSAKSEALVAAAELERRKYESGRRLEKFKEQRRAFEEIRDSLAEEEKLLLGHLESAKNERDLLVEKMESMTQGMIETGREIDDLEREVDMLDRRYSENSRREKELAGEIEKVQDDIAAARREITSVASELEAGRATLARLDRKLSLDKLKR
jgi:chromosome segregation ATPase